MLTDLHIHTTHSGGKLTVADTIKFAKESGIGIMAITDHDSVSAFPEALQIALNLDIKMITGIELSCRNEFTDVNFPGDISLHILGYNLQYDNPVITKALDKYLNSRKIVLNKIYNDLKKNGMDIPEAFTYHQTKIQYLIKFVEKMIIGDDDIDSLSKEIIDEVIPFYTNIVKSYKTELFNTYFKVADAISLIKECGGIAIWAHPFTSYNDYEKITNSKEQVLSMLDKLCELGIDGVETLYMFFNEEEVEYLEDIAKERNLFITTGSDFHAKAHKTKMNNIDSEKIKQFLVHIGAIQ